MQCRTQQHWVVWVRACDATRAKSQRRPALWWRSVACVLHDGQALKGRSGGDTTDKQTWKDLWKSQPGQVLPWAPPNPVTTPTAHHHTNKHSPHTAAATCNPYEIQTDMDESVEAAGCQLQTLG
jgi:hypothetical protein